MMIKIDPTPAARRHYTNDDVLVRRDVILRGWGGGIENILSDVKERDARLKNRERLPCFSPLSHTGEVRGLAIGREELHARARIFESRNFYLFFAIRLMTIR